MKKNMLILTVTGILNFNRTYDKMFQYLPYGLVSVTWEDNALAHCLRQIYGLHGKR